MNDASGITEFPPRMGPRPLALHLGLATTTVAGALAGVSFAQGENFLWPGENSRQSEDIAEKLRDHASPDVLEALSAQGSEMVQEMIDGINMYHQHPYRRYDPVRTVLWSAGTTSLLDCNPEARQDAPVIFIVPSLVNRSYILDLMPGRSLVNYLSEQGIRPLLLDWDAPGETEKEFTLSDYVLERICPAMDYATDRFPLAPLHLAGYCMGGTLAVAAAHRQQDKLASFIALASPWNFHEDLGPQAQMLLAQKALWSAVLEGFGELPVDLLQTFFASLDPNLGLRKFSKFSKMDMDSAKATEFVALEDWLNDGMPLVRKVAEECLQGWYGENTTYHSRWQVGGRIVRPQELTIPVLIAAPAADKIVPRLSALAMASGLPGAKIITPPSGHIGMITSRRAKDGLWQDLSDWILSC
ncbi:MAG: poly-beta-hydroxybutyrate polymerase [Sneathiella sp.]|nr:MAG: poly-beta-hydroxybutyrate polymerase [Sneathiella sp.]